MKYLKLILDMIFKDKKNIESYKKNIRDLEMNLEIATKNLELLHNRVEELENGIDSDFAVQVRNVENIIKIDFSKLEMVVIMSGVYKLMHVENNKIVDLDDMSIYIDLIKKIQDIIDKMPDEEQKGGNSGI